MTTLVTIGASQAPCPPALFAAELDADQCERCQCPQGRPPPPPPPPPPHTHTPACLHALCTRSWCAAAPPPLCRHFGARGELYRLKFCGRHSVHSGFTSFILAHELRAALAAAGGGEGLRASRKQAAEGPSWLAFASHVKGSSGEGLFPTPLLPFLFAGEHRCGNAGQRGRGSLVRAAVGSGAVALNLLEIRRCRQGNRLRQCWCLQSRRGKGNGRTAALNRV